MRLNLQDWGLVEFVFPPNLMKHLMVDHHFTMQVYPFALDRLLRGSQPKMPWRSCCQESEKNWPMPGYRDTPTTWQFS